MRLIPAVEVGRTAHSRCVVALITAGLLAGYGVVGPGQMVAEAGTVESIASTHATGGLTANIVLPGELRNPLSEPKPQTDDETLDAGAPPPTSSPPGAADDVETLDQGSPPPAGGTVSSVPVGSVAGTYVAPSTAAAAPTYASPVESTSSGPTIPPGFGTGHVHVAAGHPEFPVGLVSCHVGTITGRAYVAVDCPNGDSVVGFAPSLNDFPFILNPDFPFEGDEGFLIDAARSDAAASDAAKNNVDVLAAMPGPEQDSSTSQTQIGVSGAGSVQYAQKTRTTEPTVVTNAGQGGGNRTKSSKQSSSGNSSTRTQHASPGSDGGSNRTYSLAQRSKAHGHVRHQQHRDSANGKSRHGDNGSHAKQSHNQKNKDNQKAKDNQKSEGKKQDRGQQKDKSGEKK